MLFQSVVQSDPPPDAPVFSWQGTISRLPPRFPLSSSPSHDPLQDVEDADVVNGHKGGEVGRHVDPFEGRSCRVEGLQGLTFLHVPPLGSKQKREAQLIWIKDRDEWKLSI